MARIWNPPADLLPMVVQKARTEKATDVLIAPYWPTQAWFARLTKFSNCTRIFYSPDNEHFFVGSTARKPWPLVIAKIVFGRTSLPAFELPSLVGPVMFQVLAEEKKRRDSCQA